MALNPMPGNFDKALDAWQDWQQAPWGRLRYRVAAANLRRHLFAQAFREYDLQAALDTLDNPTHYVATFDTTITRYTDSELREMLQTAEFTPLRQYGIRTICDFLANNELKFDPDFYQKLETLELALSDKEPYKFLARFYHFIAQKG